jgi:hypothetical protein
MVSRGLGWAGLRGRGVGVLGRLTPGPAKHDDELSHTLRFPFPHPPYSPQTIHWSRT